MKAVIETLTLARDALRNGGWFDLLVTILGVGSFLFVLALVTAP